MSVDFQFPFFFNGNTYNRNWMSTDRLPAFSKPTSLFLKTYANNLSPKFKTFSLNLKFKTISGFNAKVDTLRSEIENLKKAENPTKRDWLVSFLKGALITAALVLGVFAFPLGTVFLASFSAGISLISFAFFSMGIITTLSSLLLISIAVDAIRKVFKDISLRKKQIESLKNDMAQDFSKIYEFFKTNRDKYKELKPFAQKETAYKSVFENMINELDEMQKFISMFDFNSKN